MTSSSGATTGNASLTSMRFIRLQDGGQMPLLQRKNIRLGFFAESTPDNGAPLLMHFEHLLPGGLLVETENFFEHHHDIRHQVNRIVEHHDAPDAFEGQLSAGFL